MQHQLELGYLGLEVPDPRSLDSFFGAVVGLLPGEPADGDTVAWRNDDAAHRIIVQPGAANDATFIGFDTVSEAAFDAVTQRLRDAGCELTEGTDDERKARRVDRLMRT